MHSIEYIELLELSCLKKINLTGPNIYTQNKECSDSENSGDIGSIECISSSLVEYISGCPRKCPSYGHGGCYFNSIYNVDASAGRGHSKS
jgi:hypothetical protein